MAKKTKPVRKPTLGPKTPPKTAAKAAPKTAPKTAAKASPGPVPVKPGAKPISPRLTARAPVDVDERKQKIGALATATQQIRALKRTLGKSFFEVGLILKSIEERRLYDVKGYGTFEAFLEREIELGKLLGLRLTRAVDVFQRPAALAAGMDRVCAAIAVLDGETDPGAPPSTTSTSSGGARSPIPFHKQ